MNRILYRKLKIRVHTALLLIPVRFVTLLVSIRRGHRAGWKKYAFTRHTKIQVCSVLFLNSDRSPDTPHVPLFHLSTHQWRHQVGFQAHQRFKQSQHAGHCTRTTSSTDTKHKQSTNTSNHKYKVHLDTQDRIHNTERTVTQTPSCALRLECPHRFTHVRRTCIMLSQHGGENRERARGGTVNASQQPTRPLHAAATAASLASPPGPPTLPSSEDLSDRRRASR